MSWAAVNAVELEAARIGLASAAVCFQFFVAIWPDVLARRRWMRGRRRVPVRAYGCRGWPAPASSGSLELPPAVQMVWPVLLW